MESIITWNIFLIGFEPNYVYIFLATPFPTVTLLCTDHYVFNIFTSIYVLCTPNAARNMHFTFLHKNEKRE